MTRQDSNTQLHVKLYTSEDLRERLKWPQQKEAEVFHQLDNRMQSKQRDGGERGLRNEWMKSEDWGEKIELYGLLLGFLEFLEHLSFKAKNKVAKNILYRSTQHSRNHGDKC